MTNEARLITRYSDDNDNRADLLRKRQSKHRMINHVCHAMFGLCTFGAL